jgi:hypothetical protein
MDVCIVKEDRVVVIDGEGLNFDFTLADNIWAIQWNGTLGHIEYNDGTPNEELTNFSDYQYLADAHATEKQRLADEEAQADADRIANLTYVDHRAKAYPSLQDQADMAYWDRQNGTTTLDDTITAVKAAYPKI